MQNMIWSYFGYLIKHGNGYVFTHLLADIFVSLGICILTRKIILPVVRSYQLAKSLDKSIGTNSKHWFYGHAKKDEDGKSLTDKEIRDEVDTFLFEGHDTTASALSWTIYNLAKHSDLQHKCREEVISEIGDKSNIEWEDLPKLTYVAMFIKESMRLYSPVPFIARLLDKPLQLSQSKTPKKVIPSGVNVTANIFAQHGNGHVWKSPLIFNPERFSSENVLKRSPHAFIPFSDGPRNCIGQNFAMNEMKVVISQLQRSFNFYLDKDTPEPIPTTRLVLKSEN